MTIRQRYDGIISYFQAAMPEARTELHYDSSFQLLIAVMLSAQCTDKRVNTVTPALFEAFPTAETLAEATPEAILEYISSVSYPNSKARHLAEMARMLVSEFGGEVPHTMEELVRLPGVGRKTANVVLGVAFNEATMPVDTHVFRVSHRLGLVTDKAKTPLAVEQALVKHIPQALLSRAHHWLILHGRYVCTAIKPHCLECGLQEYCKFFSKPLLPTNNNKKS
ncbi:MAG: endonuclease III [Bacteroidaceae bacterium]|nr:endonuclease III [Bacteroidaceae bacterium]